MQHGARPDGTGRCGVVGEEGSVHPFTYVAVGSSSSGGQDSLGDANHDCRVDGREHTIGAQRTWIFALVEEGEAGYARVLAGTADNFVHQLMA